MGGGFEYQSLARSKREIRLLELFPRSHKLSKIRPTCRVFTRSLDDNPPFLALSYVWGDANDTRVILVNRQPFKVTRNLYDALMSIAEDDDSIIVWIDAICINQSDDEEKGWQVGMMGDIYEQASSVLAWLGPAADNSDSVVDHLQVVGKQAEECGLHIGLDRTIQAWGAIERARKSSHTYRFDRIVAEYVLDGNTLLVTVRDLEEVLNPMKETVDRNVLFMTNLNSLFCRSWWGRIWCLQEIALPKTAYFACGSKRISRRRLSASYYAYMYLCYVAVQEAGKQQLPMESDCQMEFAALFQAPAMLSISTFYRMEKLPLITLLRETCEHRRLLPSSCPLNFESTDPRDKVFALLGIAKDRAELEKLGLSPDYTSSEREVYMRTMVALLRQGHTRMLSFCRASQMPSYLPSWVLDWSQPMVNTLQKMFIKDSSFRPKFSASEGKSLQLNVNFSKGKTDIEGISVLGSIYAMVSTVGDVPRSVDVGWCIRSHDWLIEILRLSYETQKLYSDYSERLRAVIRTSCADTLPTEGSFERTGDETFLKALNILLEDTTDMVPPDIAKPLQEYLARGDVRRMLEDLNEESRKTDNQFVGVTPDRCPFVTTGGHLGLGCSDTRQGDVVALIGGAQVPFILRPERNGNFTILSEAYVDGIMDGEAVETSEWRTINLV